MQIIDYREADYAERIAAFDRRAEPLADVREVVAGVVADVKARGDVALMELAKKFDGVDFGEAGAMRVSEAEFEAAAGQVDEAMRAALAESRDNVRDFAEKSMRRDWTGTNSHGAMVGEVFRPFQRVGIYVPGGTAPLVSSANMTVVLAAAVSVPEIVVCTPSNAAGEVNPVLLFALREAGATEVYKVGGSQAIAAMALGTETIAPVVKVFGPGNSYVVEAKRQVFGAVAVDLLPGPSEILTLSDESGKAAWIAADMLAQAEHGGDSVVGFLTDSEDLLGEVKGEVEEQAKSLTREGPVRTVLESGVQLILVSSLEEGAKLVDAFAPEHLSLICGSEEREREIMGMIHTAGAVFLGNYSPVAAGDFVAGPSHELPTGGAGKSFGGLTVDQFQRRTSVVRYDAESMGKAIPVIEKFTEVEGLDGHGRSARVRGEG
ncbi:MAG: histidinol dehydrogenase [Verrucomicrobiota bacterium]